MRERAEDATPGPWKRYGMAGVAAPDWEIVDERRVECDGCNEPVALTGCATNDDAEHVASWHPAVALEVAGFLDFAAAYADQPEPQSPTVQFACAIARAYLGRPS